MYTLALDQCWVFELTAVSILVLNTAQKKESPMLEKMFHVCFICPVVGGANAF